MIRRPDSLAEAAPAVPTRGPVARCLIAGAVAASVLMAPLALSAPAWAQQAGTGPTATPEAEAVQADVGPLLEALAMDDLMPILRAEGMSYAQDLAADMFPGRGGARWEASLAAIYDTGRMERLMAEEMAARMPAEHLPALMEFFSSDLGQRIVLLEITAREALLEDSVDEASRAALEEMRAAEAPRLALLEAFVTANDLVEMNVVGGLNSNYAFYLGLSAGGAFNGVMTEEEMLADVWSQEDDIRSETVDWVYSYLALAYQPLEDEELEAYTALSQTPAGEALNSALFASFDALFTTISRELGTAAAQLMAGEDI